MAQAAGRQCLTAQAHVPFHASRCEICVGRSGIGLIFFPGNFEFPLSVSLQLCSTLVFILILSLSKGQAREAWEILEYNYRKILSRFSVSYNYVEGLRL